MRVLHVFGKTGRGGAESMIMNYYRCIDRTQIQFDFVKHTKEHCDFDDEIQSLGGRIFCIPKFTGFNYFKYQAAWKELLLNNPEYRIIHVHHFKIAGIVNKIAKEVGVPVRIVHAHATKIEGNLISRILYKYIMKPLLLQYSNHYWACGQAAGKSMFGYRKFYVLRNAIPVRRFHYDKNIRDEIRKSFNIEQETYVVGHVGRFTIPKNHFRIIDIFSEMSKHMDNSILLLVGDGELKENVIEKVRSLGLSNKVVFAGVRSDIFNILQAVDLFLFPSLYEGFCIAPIEAQAAGIPCLLSDSIPPEVQLTDLVKFVSLESSDKEWSKIMLSLNARLLDRDKYNDLIMRCGYDIYSNSKQLMERYAQLQTE